MTPRRGVQVNTGTLLRGDTMKLPNLNSIIKSPVAKELARRVASALIVAAVAKLAKKKTP